MPQESPRAPHRALESPRQAAFPLFSRLIDYSVLIDLIHLIDLTDLIDSIDWIDLMGLTDLIGFIELQMFLFFNGRYCVSRNKK